MPPTPLSLRHAPFGRGMVLRAAIPAAGMVALHRGARQALAGFAALGLLTLAGCQRHAEGPSPSVPPAAAARPAAGSGPQIAMSADLVHIEYTVQGAGDPVIVFVHDWAASGSYWRAQAEALAGRYTVVVLNLAGHGASGRNRTDWTLAAYGQDIDTVTRQLPDRPIALVGHGMGSLAALEAAPLIGSRLLGIIAVDGLQSVGAPPLSRRAIEQQLAPLRESFVETMRARAPQLFQPDADRRFVARVGYDMSLASPQVAIASREAVLAWNPGTSLTRLTVPVLAINSDLVPTDVARIRRYLPGFTAQVLPHTGHFLMMEAPQRFNPVLLTDIEQLARHTAPHP